MNKTYELLTELENELRKALIATEKLMEELSETEEA